MDDERTEIRPEELRGAGDTLARGSGAMVLAAYGSQEVLEGAALEGVVITQFPSMKEARAFYDSPGYQMAVQHRFSISAASRVRSRVKMI